MWRRERFVCVRVCRDSVRGRERNLASSTSRRETHMHTLYAHTQARHSMVANNMFARTVALSLAHLHTTALSPLPRSCTYADALLFMSSHTLPLPPLPRTSIHTDAPSCHILWGGHRNGLLERTGHQMPKAVKTGTTIVGVIYKVGRLLSACAHLLDLVCPVCKPFQGNVAVSFPFLAMSFFRRFSFPHHCRVIFKVRLLFACALTEPALQLAKTTDVY